MPFTTTTVTSALSRFTVALLTDPQYFFAVAALVSLGDSILTLLIIRYVPYTEIDWETYIVQVEHFLNGERDYALITGPTGPIVYPAGHLYIHRVLYKLTDGGVLLENAQQMYGMLYHAFITMTCGIYAAAGGVPNWVLLLLPLSKRLHSIFVLRLFNDCWMVTAAHTAIFAYCHGLDIVGTLFLGFGLSVKMSALLYLPGVVVILFKKHGLVYTLLHLVILALTQVAIGWPFLSEYPWSYLKYSYEFSRTFLYKWTVNWRFIPEETFLSPAWATGLLVAHLTTLIAFGWFKWCKHDGGVWRVVSNGVSRPFQRPVAAPVTADNIVTILFTSNLIGMLFSRSLHYQFYSWYALQLPFLAWRTKYPTAVKLALLVGIEYAWNVFPSTPLSSAVLCAANALLLGGIWSGYSEGLGPAKEVSKAD